MEVPYDKHRWFLVRPCADPMLNFVQRKRNTRLMCKVCYADISASSKGHFERHYHLRAAEHRARMAQTLAEIGARGADGG